MTLKLVDPSRKKNERELFFDLGDIQQEGKIERSKIRREYESSDYCVLKSNEDLSFMTISLTMVNTMSVANAVQIKKTKEKENFLFNFRHFCVWRLNLDTLKYIWEQALHLNGGYLGPLQLIL